MTFSEAVETRPRRRWTLSAPDRVAPGMAQHERHGWLFCVSGADNVDLRRDFDSGANNVHSRRGFNSDADNLRTICFLVLAVEMPPLREPRERCAANGICRMRAARRPS